MNRILNFHLVNNMDWFERTILYIKSKFDLVSTDTLDLYYQGKVELKNAVHITVDDGDETFYRIIYPVLKKHQIPASLYVSPKIFKERINYWFQEIEGYDKHVMREIISELTNTPLKNLDSLPNDNLMKVMKIERIHEILAEYRKRTNTPLKPYQNMSIDELREVDRDGLVTIGAHTMNHPILHNETDKVSNDEIGSSITELAELLGHEITCFSYPNGIPDYDFTDRERNYLRDNGIKLGFSTEATSFSRKDSIYSIPRIGVSNNESSAYFKLKLFAGPAWIVIRKLKPSGEYVNRTEIKRIIVNR